MFLVWLTLGDSRAFPHTFICIFLPMEPNKIFISLKERGERELLGLLLWLRQWESCVLQQGRVGAEGDTDLEGTLMLSCALALLSCHCPAAPWPAVPHRLG